MVPRKSARTSRRPAELDRSLVFSNLEIPSYVRDGVERYMDANPGQTFRSVSMIGLRALGIEIEDEDLIPERRRRVARVRTVPEGEDAATTTVATTLRLPRYVRARAEKYLIDHPDMRFRHLVMAGFKELGIEVEPDDLVTERRNVSALSFAGR